LLVAEVEAGVLLVTTVEVEAEELVVCELAHFQF
jgi:hypothetical protein